MIYTCAEITLLSHAFPFSFLVLFLHVAHTCLKHSRLPPSCLTRSCWPRSVAMSEHKLSLQPLVAQPSLQPVCRGWCRASGQVCCAQLNAQRSSRCLFYRNLSHKPLPDDIQLPVLFHALQLVRMGAILPSMSAHCMLPKLSCDLGPLLYSCHSQKLRVLYHYFLLLCRVYSLFFQHCPEIWFSYPQLIRVINLFTEERINLPNFLQEFR